MQYLKTLFIGLALSIIPFRTMAQNDNSKTFLALGDSYTIGESVSENDRWPVQLAKKLTEMGLNVKSPKIIAKTGWRTDDLKKAIIDDFNLASSYDMVSLLIGVNNQYQDRPLADYESDFEKLLKTAIDLAGGNKDHVFVVSIPDYGKTPFGQEKEDIIRKEIDIYNRIGKKISKRYKVKYFNITPISRKAKKRPELVANDQLHPSGIMYTEWVELMIEDVAKLIKK
ncbi:SGNH/GDSL hydrolase family protein [Roseivirga sp.]|uniref:SGNH/GDSL hydrolase family protein n=1 Tax=Roseivirga sp. TaxID=1964215 RepID=UPI003BAD1F28